MRTPSGVMVIGALLLATSFVEAQRPDGEPAATARSGQGDDLVARMMRFDADKDGKLTKSELTDARLNRLFERADANHDGIVTRDELTSLAAREPSNGRGGPPGFGPPGGGPGGPMGRPPRPGEILPPMLRQRLRLSADQAKQLDALQAEVDTRLDKILNDEQRSELKQMRERGPGGFGPRGPGGSPGGDGPPPPPPPRD